MAWSTVPLVGLSLAMSVVLGAALYFVPLGHTTVKTFECPDWDYAEDRCEGSFAPSTETTIGFAVRGPEVTRLSLEPSDRSLPPAQSIHGGWRGFAHIEGGPRLALLGPVLLVVELLAVAAYALVAPAQPWRSANVVAGTLAALGGGAMLVLLLVGASGASAMSDHFMETAATAPRDSSFFDVGSSFTWGGGFLLGGAAMVLMVLGAVAAFALPRRGPGPAEQAWSPRA